MIDVSALIGDIPTTTVTLRTFGAPVVSALFESSSSSTETEVTAVVHPSSRRSLERNGLDYTREHIAAYFTEAQPDVARSARPAQIDYQGRTYEVVRVADYMDLGGIWMVHAALLDEVAS